jgi:hypothetical protein
VRRSRRHAKTVHVLRAGLAGCCHATGWPQPNSHNVPTPPPASSNHRFRSTICRPFMSSTCCRLQQFCVQLQQLRCGLGCRMHSRLVPDSSRDVLQANTQSVWCSLGPASVQPRCSLRGKQMASHAQRVAERIGRRPGVVCGVSTLITLLVSVLALVVGEFTVSADNDGWQSRTTELANRQMQLEAAWEGLDARHWSRAPVASRRKLHTSNESGGAHLLAAKPKAATLLKRRLLESDPPDSECWNGHTEWSDPTVVYRAKDAATDLLSPAVFQQVLASPSALPIPQTTRASTSSGVRARGACTLRARVPSNGLR